MGAALTALVETTKFFETNPDKFITGSLARDADGNDVSPADPKATCFCTVGKMAQLLNVDDDDVYDEVQEAIENDDANLPGQSELVSFNDNLGNPTLVVAKLKEVLADA